MCTGSLKTNSLTATVATRPRARRPATTPPAMSTCDMIQPPKMSPFWFASAGIGMTRSAGSFPSGSFSMLQIVQRPAAERREAGAEDQPGVDQIGLADDAFLEHALRFGQVRGDQLLHQVGSIRVGLTLHRSCVLPAINPLAGLLAELSRLDFGGEHLRHAGGILRQRLARRQADVEPHGVGELRRP